MVAWNGPSPDLGAVIAVIPNHVCTACFNLVPQLLVRVDHRTDRGPLVRGGGAGRQPLIATQLLDGAQTRSDPRARAAPARSDSATAARRRSLGDGDPRAGPRSR